ncbi:MAG TPA: extracellular solute-binding protein [Limnochordia bacterium]
MILSELAQELPDVEVEIVPRMSADKLAVAFAGGVAPDIVQFSTRDAPRFIANGLFVPLDLGVFGVSSRAEYARLWFPGALGTMLLYDEIYFIPNEVTTFATFYNVDMFTNAGLDKPPATWQGIGEVAKKLSILGPGGSWERSGLALNHGGVWAAFHMVAMMRQNGVDWISNEGTPNFTHPKALDALSVYADLFLSGAANPDAGGSTFFEGNAAIYPGALYEHFALSNAEVSFTAGVSPYPVLAQGKPNSPSYAWGTFVTVQAEQPRLAWQVAKFFSDQRWAEMWFGRSRLIPYDGEWLRRVYREEPTLRPFLDALQTSQVEISHPKYTEIVNFLSAADQDIIRRRAPLESALEKLNQQLTALLAGE